MGRAHVEADGNLNDTTNRLKGTDAIKAHVTLCLGLAFCVAAFWFEIRRALGGNALSWAYVFEWPLLAIFAVYMWWKVMHPEGDQSKGQKIVVIAPEFDGMLAAWEQHQQELRNAEHAPDEGSA